MAISHSRDAVPDPSTELFALTAVALVAMALLTLGYYQQGYPVIQTDGAPALSALMFFTLGGGAFIILAALAVFLSRRVNRETVTHESR